MTANMWIGLAAGVFVGWLAGAVFTKGPKTPMEAFTGDYEAGGPGCLTFLILVTLGAAAVTAAGAMMGG